MTKPSTEGAGMTFVEVWASLSTMQRRALKSSLSDKGVASASVYTYATGCIPPYAKAQAIEEVLTKELGIECTIFGLWPSKEAIEEALTKTRQTR